MSFGYIVLLGSGETSSAIRKVYEWLFSQFAQPLHVAILETPAGFEPNSAQVAGQVAQFFSHHLQNFAPQIDLIPARKKNSPFSPDNLALLEPLWRAQVIMAGAGSPTYTVRQLADSLAWYGLQARHRLGATLIFSSAATIACGEVAMPVYEIYKVGEELHWKEGLGLLRPFGLNLVFVPHWNNQDGGANLDTSRCFMGQPRYDELARLLLPYLTVVGIDENTALIIDPNTAACQVMGQGQVTIIAPQQPPQIMQAGAVFFSELLGEFHLPSTRVEACPAEAWSQLQAAFAEASETPTPSAEVEALLVQRQAARAQKDWAGADRLRAQIEALDWLVKDTLHGQEVTPKP